VSTLKKDESKQSYHHGDLRNTLVQIGTEMLIESGEASLSLRKIAQQAGVSHNAPYQHFSDKNALLAAIAEDGFRLLGEAMDMATHDLIDDTPLERLIAVGQAYVAFAIGHPSHLQLMFGSFSSADYPRLAERAHETLQKLITIVGEIGAEGQLNDDNIHDVSTAVWMTLHGMSAMLNASKLPPYIQQNRPPDILVERFIEMICKGLLK
jgi:AcrR family transcriptional regulator